MTCGYSITSAGTGVGLLCTLGGKLGTLGPGESLCTLVYAATVSMDPVTVVVAAVVVKNM